MTTKKVVESNKDVQKNGTRLLKKRGPQEVAGPIPAKRGKK